MKIFVAFVFGFEITVETGSGIMKSGKLLCCTLLEVGSGSIMFKRNV